MASKKYISHKYIKPETIEARLYQQTIFASSLQGNTLVVLPTGLGKTIVMALVIAKRMEQYPAKSIVVMAPTKPLVEQHVKTFRNVFNIIEEEIVMLSGSITPKKREKIWRQAQIIVTTPQVVENDLLAKRVELSNISLLGVDEAHRAVGDYAYVFVAKQFLKQASNPLILAITASPGSKKEKIEEVCKNLAIQHVETRSDSSHDVKPYVQETEVEWIQVTLGAKFKRIKSLLERSLSFKLKELKRLGWIESASVNISRRELLRLPPLITKQFDRVDDPSELYLALGFVGSSIRLTHALELLETQGVTSLLAYFDKMRKEAKTSKASRSLLNLLREDAMIVSYDIAQQIAADGIIHPKIPELKKIVADSVETSPLSRILVFTQYRKTAKLIEEVLNSIESVKASRFIGQASKAGDKGFSQKKQLEIMQQFRDGIYNCLVATSVGEEGLDVSECDLVVFYDCVPSAVRSIQRRGRTGRKRAGYVVVLMTKGTRDEAYFWASKHKERKMKRNLRDLERLNKRKRTDTNQRTIEDFFAAAETAEGEIEEDSVSDYSLDDLDSFSEEALQKLEEEVTTKSSTADISSVSTAEQQAIDSFQQESTDTAADTIRIIVDSRETKSKIAKELTELDVDIELEQLEVADYVLSSRVGVERKDVLDFTQSIIDGRLFKQLVALKRSYPIPVLIIEGETLYGHRALNPEAIRGAVASIAVNFDIRIIWTRNQKDTARYLRSIARREQQKSDRTPVIRSEKAPVESDELLEFILAGFPNINTILAKRLLSHFKTIEAFTNASVEEMQKVKGIGKKIAEEIKTLLRTKYEKEFAE